MLLKFDDPVSLTGARLEACRPLELSYGTQHTLELECAYGRNNELINMQTKGCTRWTLSLLKNLSSPDSPLLEETFNDNIAVGSRLYFTFAMTTLPLYKYVAGGEAMCVMDIKGYEPDEVVPAVCIQLPVYIKSAMTQKKPNAHGGTVNDGTITFTRDGEVVGSFSANAALDTVIELNSKADPFTGVRAIQVNGDYVQLTPSGTASIRIPKPIDDNTITDENGVLEVQGVIDTNGQSKVSIWIGTRREWEEQEKINSQDLCIITDDVAVVEELYPTIQSVRTIPVGESSIRLSNEGIYEHAPVRHTLTYTLPDTTSNDIRYHVQLTVLVQSSDTVINIVNARGAIVTSVDIQPYELILPVALKIEAEFVQMLRRWSVKVERVL